MRAVWRLLLLPLGAMAFAQAAGAMTLINTDEAQLPDPPVIDEPVRGLNAATAFFQMLPPRGAVAHSPFQLVIRFEDPCDPATLVISYFKQPAIDLTARIKPYINAQGINIPDAEAPPGNYKLRLVCRTDTGKREAGFVLFSVAP